MLKFFRKFVLNKAVMVVIASFLMVLFLLPGVDIFTPDGSSQPIGTVDGEVLRMHHRQTANAEMRTLATMGLGQALPADELSWLLLIREARQHGLYASPAEARGFIDQLQDSMQIDPRAAAQQVGVSEELMLQALQHFLMVSDLQEMIFSAGRPSEPRLAHFVRDMQSTASADVAVIDAEHLLDSVDGPSEADIQAHFEEYRDDRPSESEPYGFGYFLPRRVKLEYLAVPLSRVEANIEIEESDAYGFYIDNPQLYLPEDAEGEGEPLEYREVRQRVHEDLLEQEARRTQDEIVSWVAARLSQEERRLEPGERGYRDVPEDYQPLSFDELASRVQERWGVLPDVVRVEDDWLTREEVIGLEGFGSAYLEASGREYAVQTYVFSVPEVEPAETNPLLALGLQVGVASRPVRDDTGDRYVFRVTAAEPPREPRDLDEVRDDVVRDLKRLRAYEMLQQQAQELRLRAVEDGLEALAKSYDTTVRELEGFRGRDFLEMQPPNLPGVGRSPEFVDAVFAAAQQAREEAGSIEDANVDQTTLTVGLDNQQAVAVARVRAYQPVDQRTYQLMRQQMASFVQRATMAQLELEQHPLSLEAVKQRVGFVDARPEDEQEQDDTEADPSVATSD